MFWKKGENPPSVWSSILENEGSVQHLDFLDDDEKSVFKTAFVDGTHPKVAQPKRFSLIEAGDWVNIIPLTKAGEVVVIRQFRPGTAKVQIEIPQIDMPPIQFDQPK